MAGGPTYPHALMEAGIVGLPNVGKSTLFNALTKAGALAANYPFATIEPNVGIVPIPDSRLETITKYIPPQKVIPAALRLVDIAGIVKGASVGEGLGNKFLSHIREVDAILQVVRCFTKAPGGEDILHVSGTVDPLRDIDIINTELVLADLQTVEGAMGKSERAAKSGKLDEVARFEVLKKYLPVLSAGTPARAVKFDDAEQIKQAKQLGLITSKRVLYVMNVDEDDLAGQNDLCKKVRAHAASEGAEVVPVCAKIESELSVMADSERQEMLEALGLTEPALAAVAHAAYRTLGLQSYFTAGEKEVRAWTVAIGATAPQAAGVIHTDFEKGFIRVEVYTLADLEKYKTEKAIKEAGKLRIEGKDYIMKDGDICHFLFNV
jgi:GTP-binding protein YchF